MEGEHHVNSSNLVSLWLCDHEPNDKHYENKSRPTILSVRHPCITLLFVVSVFLGYRLFVIEAEAPDISNNVTHSGFAGKTVFRNPNTILSFTTHFLAACRYQRRCNSFPKQRTVKLYLTILLLLNSYAPEPNPGPDALLVSPPYQRTLSLRNTAHVQRVTCLLPGVKGGSSAKLVVTGFMPAVKASQMSIMQSWVTQKLTFHGIVPTVEIQIVSLSSIFM